MEVLHSHCAGLDIHQKEIVVCTLIGSKANEIQMEIKSFPTMTRDLYKMLKWLEDKGITHLAMESTGVYWKPVYNILEDFFEIILANAQHIKKVPGKKTDVSDAEWIATLLRHGLIPKSFVPTADLRELRDLTRFRKKLIGNLTSEKNRIQKVLEASNVKLKSVISDIFGVSGRKLLTKLVDQGYVDLDDVTENIHYSLKPKVNEISESLYGTITKHQIFLIRQSWNHIVYLERSIQELEDRINSILSAYQEEVDLLLTIPGVKKNTVASIIAEIGVDMEQFPSAQNLASWAGVAPGNNESAGKKKSEKTVKGNPHIKTALCESAWAISKSRKTRLSAKFWSLSARRGKKKALIATAHKLLKIIYAILVTKIKYIEEKPA